MSSRPLIIHWFRQDLRLADNPALHTAAQAGDVLPVYILDEKSAGPAHRGAASRVWLHHSLKALDSSLKGNLALYRGEAADILSGLAKREKAAAVYWNRCYESWQREQEKQLEGALEKAGIEAKSFNGSLLWEPWEITKKDGTPYRIYTPFFKKGCLKAAPPRSLLSKPHTSWISPPKDALALEKLALLPAIPWDGGMMKQWQAGETHAHARLDAFLTTSLKNYKKGRDYPADTYGSRLSPHLHFGEISPHQVWHAVSAIRAKGGADADAEHFMSELGWREFNYSQLYYHPTLPADNLKKRFDAFPWQYDKKALKAWQRGMTGYPLVDAGMRELWQTGFMHNRVRMVVGSFLVKNLLLDWREGERWFWDCLVDADLANNATNWQWVAGCGTDAAPYFRVFNPVLQAKKYDGEGKYIRRYVPELSRLPDKYLFTPWEAPKELLRKYGVTLGHTYPHPVVNVETSRQRALAAYKSL